MTDLTVRLQNFRVHRQFLWTPSGVCVLSGANGAGKTTALEALQFLGILFNLGVDSAFNHIGANQLLSFGVDRTEIVEIEVTVNNLRWLLRFPEGDGRELKRLFGEELYRDDELEVQAKPFSNDCLYRERTVGRDETRCCAKYLWDRGEASWMEPLVQVLANIRSYASYWLNQVARPQLTQRRDSFLHHSGNNLWNVLAHWQAAPITHRGLFDRVMQQTRNAFPGIMGTLEFDRGMPFLYRPGTIDPTEGLPPSRAADGLLTGLLHLTAVIGAKDGAILAFDEVENQLHPHAIRSIIATMRDEAQRRGLTIILTTHSPVVLNEFKGAEDHVFILEADYDGQLPVALDKLHDEAWLAHFSLGDLYERNKFAAPADAAKASGTND